MNTFDRGSCITKMGRVHTQDESWSRNTSCKYTPPPYTSMKQCNPTKQEQLLWTEMKDRLGCNSDKASQ